MKRYKNGMKTREIAFKEIISRVIKRRKWLTYFFTKIVVLKKLLPLTLTK